MEIWLVILSLTRKKFHAKQFVVLSNFSCLADLWNWALICELFAWMADDPSGMQGWAGGLEVGWWDGGRQTQFSPPYFIYQQHPVIGVTQFHLFNQRWSMMPFNTHIQVMEINTILIGRSAAWHVKHLLTCPSYGNLEVKEFNRDSWCWTI